MIYDNFEVQKPKRSSSCYDKQTSSQNNIAKIPYQNQNENFNIEDEDEQFEDNPQYQHKLNNQQTKSDAVDGKCPVGRYDMAQYQDSMSSNKNINRQGEQQNAFDDELYSEIDGERIEKSGNTYNEYIDQEILFDEDQVNYQQGVRSNYSSNNTNNQFNSQNQLGNNHNQAQSHHTSGKKYQNYDKYAGEDYSGTSAGRYNNMYDQTKEEIGSANAVAGSNASIKRQRNTNNEFAQQYLMRQFYSQSANNCTICLSKISLNRIVQQQLHEKYYELFNFYFAKGINEILANVNTSHVILFKDYLYMDDSSEYLKRYYQYHEYFPRFSLLADFYTHQYKETRPNLCIVSQSRIVNKRNYKQAKLFITNQERAYRMNDQNQNQGNQFVGINFQDNGVQDDQKVLQHSVIGQNTDEQNPISNFLNELDTNFDGNSVENLNNQSGFIQQTNAYPHHHQNILHQDQNINQVQYQEGSFMNEFNRFDRDNSFESKSHDIYYPSYSSDNQSQSSINKDPLNQLKNITQNLKGDDNESLSHNNYILELKSNWNDDIFIKNPNIRLRGNFISIQSRSSSNILTNNKNSNIKISNNQINSLPIQDKTNQISTSGQLTPKYNNYFYNELQDLESEMPSYLKIYLEDVQIVNSFSQPQQSGNVSSQLSPVNQQQANLIKFSQTQQLQQQINKLQFQHPSILAEEKIKQQNQNPLNLLQSVSGHYMSQGIQPVTPQSNQTSKNYQNQSNSNSQIMKDNRFKIPSTAQQISASDVEQWKQPPLSARNHAEVSEEIRKKKNVNPKGIIVPTSDQVSYSKAIQSSTPRQLVQQMNDLTANSSSNQNEKAQQISSSPQFQCNPNSARLQNSANLNSSNKIDQNYNLDQIVSASTPRDSQVKQQIQQQIQQQQKQNKNTNLRPNKTPLQVDTKPENNYDYLLKENHLSGGVTGPSLKQNAHQQQNQQFQLPSQQQQMAQSQQYSQQTSQQQQKQNSLLNRIPQNVKQQLALNFNDNELLQKNLKINQIQQSPDRIWTDRDVNPRLAANPQKIIKCKQKERPQQQNTVVIGKGEVKHLKGGKVLNRPLSNNNELMGSLSDRIFLNKIQEEEGRNHHLPQDYNKFISEQHKELSQKIIQNALNNQMNKINSSSNSNIQEIYRKYQQAREENQQNFYNSNNMNSQDQTSIKNSGEHLSFIKAIQQKHDDQANDILSKVYAIHNSVNINNDQKEEHHNNNLTNHIKQQLNKQKQQQQSNQYQYDETISKIHKSKINQLIQKATPSSNTNQTSQKKGGTTANSSNNHGNSNINNIININNNINIIAKHSINNSSSQNSNYTQNNQYIANQHVNSQQRKQNKKSPPHGNYSNLNSYNNQLNQQTTQSSNNNLIQVSNGSSNTNQTNFHNSQLYQQLQQQNGDLYNNSIGTISNQAVSKLQQEIKQNACTPNRMAHKDQQTHSSNQLKQARTSSLIKNLSGDHEAFNESNYKIQKQQKQSQAAIIVPTAQHMLQQYQQDQMQHSNQVMSTQNNQQNKSPISSTVSTCKNVNQKQLSYTSMHNHLQNHSNTNSKTGKITPNSTVYNSNLNQNGKVFFKSINASGNTSSQALKTGNQTNANSISNNHNNNNININTILNNNYISPTNHNQNTTTPLNIMNNYKSTNNTSQKSYQESHQNSMDKNGSSSRQLQLIHSQQQQLQQQQIQQQSQKNLSQNQIGINNTNQNSINVNNSTLNQNGIINFDINSQLSRTMMSNTNRGGGATGGFNEVNSFNNNNETTLNQKSLIQPGSSHSTTGITNSNNNNNNNNNINIQTNTPINGAQAFIQASLNQKISSPNHKKKQKSESLSKSTQKNHNHAQAQQMQNQNIQFISNELSGGITSQSPMNQNLFLQQQQLNNLNQNGLQILPFEQTQQASSLQNKQILPSPSSYGQSQQNSIIPPQKKQEFKLNISKIINQQHEFNSSQSGNKNIYSSSSTTNMNSQNMNHLLMQNNLEENQENSYGFWTSRSNKQNYQHSSQLQQYASQHGSSSTSKYSSSNPKQANLTDRKLVKTSNNSKQRKEAHAANLTDRNQYHRSQQYQVSQQKHDNQKPSPQNRKNPATKNQNSKNIESHFTNQNSLTGKEKINFMCGSGSLSGFTLKK